MNLTRRRAVSWLSAALLAATLLYYSVRGVEWSQVGRILRNRQLSASPGLRPHLDSHALSARGQVADSSECRGRCQHRQRFLGDGRGYLGNNFLPARAGELVRTFMIASREGTGKLAYVLATQYQSAWPTPLR